MTLIEIQIRLYDHYRQDLMDGETADADLKLQQRVRNYISEKYPAGNFTSDVMRPALVAHFGEVYVKARGAERLDIADKLEQHYGIRIAELDINDNPMLQGATVSMFTAYRTRLETEPGTSFRGEFSYFEHGVYGGGVTTSMIEIYQGAQNHDVRQLLLEVFYLDRSRSATEFILDEFATTPNAAVRRQAVRLLRRHRGDFVRDRLIEMFRKTANTNSDNSDLFAVDCLSALDDWAADDVVSHLVAEIIKDRPSRGLVDRANDLAAAAELSRTQMLALDRDRIDKQQADAPEGMRDDFAVRMETAAASYKAGDYCAAATSWRQAATLAPYAQSIYELWIKAVQLCGDLNQQIEAVTLYHKKAQNFDTDALVELINRLENAGHDQTLPQARKYAQLNPYEGGRRYLLALCRAEEFNAAATYCRRVVKKLPDVKGRWVLTAYYAEMLLDADRFEAAGQLMQQLSETATPDDAEAVDYLQRRLQEGKGE